MPEQKRRSPLVIGTLLAIIVISILIFLRFLSQITIVVELLLISIVIASAIDPIVERVHGWEITAKRWHLPKALVILLVVFGAALVIAGVFTYVGYVAYLEGSDFLNHLPAYTNTIQSFFNGLHQRYPQIPAFQNLASDLQSQILGVTTFLNRTTNVVISLFTALAYLLSVIFMSFYMILEKESIKDTVLFFISPDYRDKFLSAMSEAIDKMGGWLRGQLMLAGVIIAIVTPAMWLLGMPYPFLIGVISGTAELIPFMGPIVGLLVAGPIALLTKPLWVFAAVVIFFLAFSQTEGNVLVPMIMRSQVELSPIITIFALVSGGVLFGPLGALLAIPISAAIRVLVMQMVMPPVQAAYKKEDSSGS